MGSSTTKTTSESKPPVWAAPLFQQSADAASALYKSGAGGNVYQGQTVAGLGGTTQAGISGVQNAANAYNNPNITNMLSSSASGKNLAGMAAGNMDPSAAKSYLTNYANGSMVGNNPYFNDALKGQLDQTANQVQSQFSGAGRYGSGANTNALTTSLGNIRSSALSNQYNQDVQNQLAATGQIDAATNAERQNQISANSNIDAANVNNANALNSWNQNQLGAQKDVISAGQLQDQALQDQLNANLNKFQAQDNAGWSRLGLLQSAASGSAGNYGTNIQTQTTPFNPFSAIGAGLGGAAQLAKKSDIRLKENIIHVGEHNGHKVYEWNYIGEHPSRRFRGVMAQEVLKTRPDAVVVEDDGFYAVRYDLIGVEMEVA